MSFRVKMPRGLGGHSRPVQRVAPPPKTETTTSEISELDKLLSLPDFSSIADLDSIVGDQLLSFDENIERWANIDNVGITMETIDDHEMSVPNLSLEDHGRTGPTGPLGPSGIIVSGTGFLKPNSFMHVSPPGALLEELSLESDFIQVNNIVRLNYGFSFAKISLDDKHKFVIGLSLPELPKASTSGILRGTGYGILDQSDGNSYLLLCKGNIQENGEFRLVFVGSKECSEGELQAHGSWSYLV